MAADVMAAWKVILIMILFQLVTSGGRILAPTSGSTPLHDSSSDSSLTSLGPTPADSALLEENSEEIIFTVESTSSTPLFSPNISVREILRAVKESQGITSSPSSHKSKYAAESTIGHSAKTATRTPVPQLPKSYVMKAEVKDIVDDETLVAEEQLREGSARHSVSTKWLNVTCIFDNNNEEGYLVEGVKCNRNVNLPRNCFCTTTFCRPYLSLRNLLHYLRSFNATAMKESVGGVGGIETYTWTASNADMIIEAIYTVASMGPRTKASPGPDDLVPLSFTVKGSGSLFGVNRSSLWLQYNVRGWSLIAPPVPQILSTPEGVFCPVKEKKFLPPLANHFSLTMETVIENLGTIAYERQHYESEERLFAFTYRPHLHADGMFLLNVPGLRDLSTESYRIIHDFKTGTQYMINEKTNNCTVQSIPAASLDAVHTDEQRIRLRHASELISIDPNQFLYKGTRVVRGIPCDVWVADRHVRNGQYSTVEVYFSHENWTVEVEVFNKVRQIPIGVSSYIADSSSPTEWSSVVHTYFYEYRDGHSSWQEFDISPCFGPSSRLFLLLTLEVSYSELVHYNLEAAKNSIRKAIAGIAGVTPLRITDIFLSSRPETGRVDVRFVLLERPEVTGPVLKPFPRLMMADAYKLLHDIISKNNISVRLDLSSTKKVFVTIQQGSLQTSSSALPSHIRHTALMYLKAGYTAGSMAGLGFSMVILGICVGILVGFLLWKRNTGVPYKITQ